MPLHETIDSHVLAELSAAAQTGLTAHNIQSGMRGEVARGKFGIYISNNRHLGPTTTIQAAACCAYKGDWLHIELIWVDQRLRGQGLGSQMMEAIEEKAKAKNCIGMHLTTFDFQAPAFYEQHGFESFATLDDFPVKGHKRYYMIKRL